MKLPIFLAVLAAVIAVGLVVAVGDEGEGERALEGRAVRTAPVTPTTPPRNVAVVWGIDDGTGAARRLRRHRAIERTTVVGRGTAVLRSAHAAGGRAVDRAPTGHGIPLDVVSVEPRDYAAVVAPRKRRVLARLKRGQALLSRTSANLRRVGDGGTLQLDGGRRLRVIGVVPDEVAEFSELVVARSEGFRSVRETVVAMIAEGAEVSSRELARAAGGRGRARLIGTPLGDPGRKPPRGPARQAELKARFGEPAVALPYGDDWVRVDRAFVRRQLVTRRVPVLGSVTCHRKMLPALRAAMRALDRRRLARLVDPSDYAGCYAPRRIRPGGALSLHAWGLAVDLNARANPFGGRSRQDPRLVRIMERHGFSWGGDFPTRPDPMHFEYRGRAERAGR